MPESRDTNSPSPEMENGADVLPKRGGSEAPPSGLDRLVTLPTAQLWQIAEALTDIDWLLDRRDLLPSDVLFALNWLLDSTADLLDDRGELPDLLGLDDGDDLDPLWESWENRP